MRVVLVSLGLALVLYAVPQVGGQAPRIALDSSRPYLDIVFQRFGPRAPQYPGESDQGVWLRLRNNCILPVEVHIIPNRRGEEALVQHFVVDSLQEIHSSLQRAPRLAKPSGYGSLDIVNSREIAPGAELVVSVPLSHITRAWFIRVEVFLVHPVEARGIQPRTFVEFDWSALPSEAREASDLMLFGKGR